VRPGQLVLLDLLAGHTCLQGPLCHRWSGDGVPIDGCRHRTCWVIVNDVAVCRACIFESPPVFL
jgi:hypothetical protein